MIVDFLRCLWAYAKEQITREIGAVADLGERASRMSVLQCKLKLGLQIPPMYGSQSPRHGTLGDAR